MGRHPKTFTTATLRELEMKGGTVAAHQLLNLVS
jgi:hypothetical protein